MPPATECDVASDRSQRWRTEDILVTAAACYSVLRRFCPRFLTVAAIPMADARLGNAPKK